MQPKLLHPFTLPALIGTFLSLQYIVPVFIVPLMPDKSSIVVNARHVTIESFLISFWLIALFITINILLVRTFKAKSRILEISSSLTYFLAGLVALLAGCLVKIWRISNGTHLGWKYLPPSDEFFVLQYTISLNTFFYIALAFFILSKYQKSRWQTLYHRIATGYLCILIVLSTINLNGKFYLFLPIFIYFYISSFYEKINVKHVFASALLLLVVLFPAKNLSRELNHINSYFDSNVISDLPPGNGSRNVINLLSGKIGNNGLAHSNNPAAKAEVTIQGSIVAAYRYVADTTLGRLNASHIFGILVETPDREGSRPWCNYLSSLSITSILDVTSCPADPMVSRFNVESGLSDSNTGIGLGVLGGFYYNHGILGASIATCVFALVIFTFNRIFSTLVHLYIPATCIIFPLILINMETSVVAMVQRIIYELLLISSCLVLGTLANRYYYKLLKQ